MKRIIYLFGGIPLVFVIYFLFAKEVRPLKIEVLQDLIPDNVADYFMQAKNLDDLEQFKEEAITTLEKIYNQAFEERLVIDDLTRWKKDQQVSIQKHYEERKVDLEIQKLTSNLKIGDIAYIPINNLTPGQLRYAQPVVQTKVVAQKKIGLIHDDGKSTLAKTEKDAVPVIKAPFGLVIKDKHHETLAAIKSGATTVPIQVVDDLSNMTAEDFWKKAEEKGHTYPYNLKGQRQIPTSFTDLQDDPNRQFATIISRKCINVGDPAEKTLPDGAEYPVWIKILSGDKKTRAFIEFIIADKLYKHGILYTYDMEKTKPEEYAALVEKVREILIEDLVPGIKVIPEKKRYTEIKDICWVPRYIIIK